MLEPPVTVEDYLGAVEPTLPHNEPERPHDKPRASLLSWCARANAYYMLGTSPTNGNVNGDGDLTTEQGSQVEAMSRRRFWEGSGRRYKIAEDQRATPEDFWATGHIDGMIMPVEATGLHRVNGRWSDRMRINGLVWGWEHKHLGRFSFLKVLKTAKGEEPVPDIHHLAQIATYGAALEWDAATLCVLAQDQSAIRFDMRNNQKAAKPNVRWASREQFGTFNYHTKIRFHHVDLRPLTTLRKQLQTRAQALSAWRQQARIVLPAPEFDPDNRQHANFPCGYCDWRDQCVQDGRGGPAMPQVRGTTGQTG
jgi:hypothetical protein